MSPRCAAVPVREGRNGVDFFLGRFQIFRGRYRRDRALSIDRSPVVGGSPVLPAGRVATLLRPPKEPPAPAEGTALDRRSQPLALLVHQWEEQRPDLDLRAFRAVGVIMQLAQVLESEFRVFAQAKFGLGSGDLRILMALRRAGKPYALRPTDLFRSLLVTSGAVTKQIERLVETGFVRRVLPEGARRRHLIALTPRGVQAANLAQETICGSLAGIAPTLKTMPARDVEKMLAGLETLLGEAVARHAEDA